MEQPKKLNAILFILNKDFHRRFAIKQKYSGQRDFFLELFVVSLKTSEWSIWVSNKRFTYISVMVENFFLLSFHLQFH